MARAVPVGRGRAAATHRFAGTPTRPEAGTGRVFQTHLRACQGSSADDHRRWRDGIYASIHAGLSHEGDAGLTIEQQCRWAEVSRAGFYRSLARTAPEEEDVLLRERLQQLVVAQHRRCGYRPISALLRREGYVVNRKRVLRLMQEDNLLCLRRQKFVFTTDPKHELPIYPNLARRLTLTGLNQLWVADITYIRLQREFIYLAVILDAYSRRVIGWALDRSLHTELPLTALRQTLATRTWRPGELIHHSDRGVQYASHEYTALLERKEYDIQISMSRRGNPYDNAKAERFMRTLKQEEVYGGDYRDLDDARVRIGQFLDEVYNKQRLHSALQYVTAAEFEQAKEQARASRPPRSLEPVETDGARET